MSAGWAPKRFWSRVEIAELPDGYEIRLDDRPVRTPGKLPLLCPTESVARMLAAEWEAQSEAVDPNTMPATRMANSAIEKVAPAPLPIVDHLLEYGETDLLCYRAGSPSALVDRQNAAWDPWVKWTQERFGVELAITAGVMPVSQPRGAVEAFRPALVELSAFQLAAFYDLVTLPGSLVLGLAAADGAATPETLWHAARTDELWQMEQWGSDEEAEETNARKAEAFAHAFRFFRASGTDSSLP